MPWRTLAILSLLAFVTGACLAAAPKPAVVVITSDECDGKLFQRLMAEQGIVHEKVEEWLDPAEYERYSMVVIGGATKHAYAAADLPKIDRFLRGGGILLVLEGVTQDLFAAPEAKAFLRRLLGKPRGVGDDTVNIRQPEHAWVRPLAKTSEGDDQPLEIDDDLDAGLGEITVDVARPAAWRHKWLHRAVLLPVANGESIIGSKSGLSALHRLPVGEGQIVHLGWKVLVPAPLEQDDDEEAAWEAQKEEQREVYRAMIGNLGLCDHPCYMRRMGEVFGKDTLVWTRPDGPTPRFPGPADAGEELRAININAATDEHRSAISFVSSFKEDRRLRLELSPLVGEAGQLPAGAIQLRLQKEPDRDRLAKAMLKLGQDPIYGAIDSAKTAAAVADRMLQRYGTSGWTAAPWLFDLEHVVAFDPNSPDTTLAAGENLPVWLMVRPSAAAPGVYRGRLTVEIVGGTRTELPVTLALRQVKRPALAPMRPLPAPSQRPLAPGPARYVDVRRGNNANAGAKDKPWQTMQHAVDQLKPGDTLYLRGGVYHEHVTVSISGQPGQPVTIRSFPGELAIIDGGIPEFLEDPAGSWEPYAEGMEGEFRSTKTYPDLGGVLGNFAESMVPLHGYRNLSDFRSRSLYRAVHDKYSRHTGIYCGPGIRYDGETERIHVRLAHMELDVLALDKRYRGEMDPRRVPMVIGGKAIPLRLSETKHVRLQDLAVRGARGVTAYVDRATDIVFDNVTIHAGHPALTVRGTRGFRMVDSAVRGTAAPWTFRGDQKYRALDTKLLVASGYDIEFAYCEFTDHHDGNFFGGGRSLWMHHSFVDNFNDDGIFLTAGTGSSGKVWGGNVHLYQNYMSGCLSTLAFGIGHGYQKHVGSGVYVYRNVFDLRRPVHYGRPGEPNSPAFEPDGPNGLPRVAYRGRVWGEHGGPMWEPMFIYHNTVITHRRAFRGYYAAGWASHSQLTKRRIFNNIFVQMTQMPGLHFPPLKDDFHADANLNWSVSDGPSFEGDFFGDFRVGAVFAGSKRQYPPGWEASGRFGDPKFRNFVPQWWKHSDFRLTPESPAVDAGLDIDKAWPDPLRGTDQGRPDLGAFPIGYSPQDVGVRGRISIFAGMLSGRERQGPAALRPLDTTGAYAPAPATPKVTGTAAIMGVSRYSNARLLMPMLKDRGMECKPIQGLLPAQEFSRYDMVAVAGAVEPNYDAEALEIVAAYLRQGGVLLVIIGRGVNLLFVPEGREFTEKLAGKPRGKGDETVRIQLPDHPWVKHLKPPPVPPVKQERQEDDLDELLLD